MQSTNAILGSRTFIRGGSAALKLPAFLYGRRVSFRSTPLSTTLFQSTMRHSAVCESRLSTISRSSLNAGKSTILVRSASSVVLGFWGLLFLRTKSKGSLIPDLKKINWSDSIAIRQAFKGDLEAYKKAFIQAVKEDDALMQVGLVIAYWEARWDKDHLKEESAFANKELKKFLSLTEWKYYGYINLYEECFPNIYSSEELVIKAKGVYKKAASLGFLPAQVFHLLEQVRKDKGCSARDARLIGLSEIKKLADLGDPEAQFYYGKSLFEEAHKIRNEIEENKQKKEGLLLMYHSRYLEVCPLKKNFMGDYDWEIDDDGRSVFYKYEEAVFLSSGVLICKESWLKKHLNLD